MFLQTPNTKYDSTPIVLIDRSGSTGSRFSNKHNDGEGEESEDEESEDEESDDE